MWGTHNKDQTPLRVVASDEFQLERVLEINSHLNYPPPLGELVQDKMHNPSNWVKVASILTTTANTNHNNNLSFTFAGRVSLACGIWCPALCTCPMCFELGSLSGLNRQCNFSGRYMISKQMAQAYLIKLMHSHCSVCALRGHLFELLDIVWTFYDWFLCILVHLQDIWGEKTISQLQVYLMKLLKHSKPLANLCHLNCKIIKIKSNRAFQNKLSDTVWHICSLLPLKCLLWVK